MSVEVPRRRNTPQIGPVLASSVVSSTTWADVGRLMNWIHGRGMHIIPTYHPGKPTGATSGPALVKATNDAYRFRYYVRPQYPALERIWSMVMKGDGNVTMTINGTSLGTFSGSESPSGAVFETKQTLASQQSTDLDFYMSLEPGMTDMIPFGISCVDIPRYDLVADGNDRGVEVEHLRSGQPIKREDLVQIFNALGTTAPTIGRRVLCNWAVPYHDGSTDITAYAAKTTATSATDIWADPIPMLGRKLNTSATTATIKWKMYAWVTSGTGAVQMTSSVNGASSSVPVTALSPTWVGGTLTIDCTDLTATTGLQSATWDGIDAQMTAPSGQTIYVASVAAWED